MERTSRCRKHLFFTVILWGVFLAACPTVLAQSQWLPNGTFAEGVEGWNAAVRSGGSAVSLGWDATTGDPAPGSLQLSVSGSADSFYIEAQSVRCFDLAPDVLYLLRAQVLLGLDSRPFTCDPIIVIYVGEGCTGERFLPGNLSPNEPGVWESRETGIRPTAPVSVRAGLLMTLTSSFDGTASCNFDSVVFGPASPPSPLEVPVVSEAGLVALGLLLASAGLVLLWGRRP